MIFVTIVVQISEEIYLLGILTVEILLMIIVFIVAILITKKVLLILIYTKIISSSCIKNSMNIGVCQGIYYHFEDKLTLIVIFRAIFLSSRDRSFTLTLLSYLFL